MDVKILFIVVFGICGTRAFHTLIPEGKELIYEYEGTISASTHVPRPYASSFTLHGNLHVQKDNQTVFVKFSDLKYKLFNGLDDEYDSKILPIPKELEDFSKAFRIQYEPTGSIAGIATGKDEKQYVVNFKKGISSMFQLDLEMMEKYDNQDIYAFHTYENTIYGKGRVNYNVKGYKDSYHIDVMQEPSSMRHMYTYLISNVDYDSTSSFSKPLSRDSQRSCVLTKIGNDKVINHMSSTGGVYNTPFNGKGEAHVIFTNQSLGLTSTNPISSKIVMESEVYHDGLTYHVADLHSVDSTVPDITNGRGTLPKEIMVETAIALIQEILDLAAEYKIDDEKPDLEKSEVLLKLFGMTLFFDDKMLDEMYEKLSNDKARLNIYIQMLTQVGTHAAYRKVLKLKREKKVINEDVLYNMFVNVKYPNKKLVEDMAEILEWNLEDHTLPAYGAAVLSFGSLLNKAVERNKRYTHGNSKNHHKHDFHPDNKLEEEFPGDKYYEKYVLQLVDKLKATKRYELQILYLQALYNTKMESIVHHLLPAVKGEWWKDSHLRMMAAIAITPVVFKNHDLIYEIYWPFMANPNTPTTFRTVCYVMIMKSQPSLQRLINIYWVMESMKNHELYKFHYEYITAVSESENPDNRKFIMNVRKLLKYTYKPVFRGITGYHYFDYFNEDYSLGEEFDLITIHSKFENDIVFCGSYSYSVNGLTAVPYWVFLRISGFHPSFLKALKLDTTSKHSLFTWETLKNVVLNVGKSDDVKITLLLATNGNIMTSYAYDKNNIMELISLIKLLKGENHIDDASVDVSYELSKSLILPTDMGFPAVSYNYVPVIDYTNITFSKLIEDDEIGLSFDIKYKSLTNARRGMYFYNPFLDVYQGVSKLHAMDYEINFRLKACIDSAHNSLKMSWTRESPDEVLYAERSYTDTLVHLLDDSNPGVLQKSAPSCKNFESVTLGEEYKTNKTTRTIPVLDIGSDFVEFVFDLEEQLPIELDPQLDLKSDKSNAFLKDILYPLRFEELQPADRNYGITRSVRVNKLYPVKTFAMTLKLDAEYKKGNNYLYPAVAYKLKLHSAAGNAAGTLTGLEAEAKLELNDGHTNSVFSGYFTEKLGDLDFAYCYAGVSALSLPDSASEASRYESTIYVSTGKGEMCTKNNSLAHIKIHGQQSGDQRDERIGYESCHENVVGPIDNQKSLDCLFEYDSLRRYTVNIEHFLHEDKKDEYKGKMGEWASKIFSDTDPIEGIEGVKSNEIRTVFELPMRPAELSKLLIYTEDTARSHKLSDKLQSLNAVYGSMFEILHTFGLTEVCIINNPRAKFTDTIGVEHEYAHSKDWALFLGTIKTEPKFEILMKSAEGNDMALKFEFKTHTLVVEPKGDKYMFTIDGVEVNNNVWTNEWMHYACIKNTKLVSIYVKNIGCHIIYNGHQASIEYPQIEGVEMEGRCLDGSHLV